jgi:hypothetical protein
MQAALWNLVRATLVREHLPRTWELENTDVQITRGWWGVSV